MSLRLLLGNYWYYTNRMAGNLKLRWSQRIKNDEMVGAKLHQIVNPLPPDEIISFFWLQSILRWTLSGFTMAKSLGGLFKLAYFGLLRLTQTNI
jgi:hypothetical protein